MKAHCPLPDEAAFPKGDHALLEAEDAWVLLESALVDQPVLVRLELRCETAFILTLVLGLPVSIVQHYFAFINYSVPGNL